MNEECKDLAWNLESDSFVLRIIWLNVWNYELLCQNFWIREYEHTIFLKWLTRWPLTNRMRLARYNFHWCAIKSSIANLFLLCFYRLWWNVMINLPGSFVVSLRSCRLPETAFTTCAAVFCASIAYTNRSRSLAFVEMSNCSKIEPSLCFASSFHLILLLHFCRGTR
jgi:hypothetical protein